MHRGPLPPPDMLREYQALIPDCPERFMKTFENQVKHRMKLEVLEMEGNMKLCEEDRTIIRRGQDRAFLIAIVFAISSLIALLNGQTIGGSVLGGGTLAALTITFLGRKPDIVPPKE